MSQSRRQRRLQPAVVGFGWWWIIAVAFGSTAWLARTLSPLFGDDGSGAWLAIAIAFTGVVIAFAALLVGIPAAILAVLELWKRLRQVLVRIADSRTEGVDPDRGDPD